MKGIMAGRRHNDRPNRSAFLNRVSQVRFLPGAGVDVRTVAGRLGHSGGGSTTLRVYSAWVSEVDQRAAGSLAARMPELPAGLRVSDLLTPTNVVPEEDASPYQRIALDLRAAIRCGAIPPGDQLPPVAEIAARYEVALSTAHRALAVLSTAGLVEVSRGRRAVVVR